VLAAGAQAQEAPVEEIVITGSRIAAPNMSSTSPVQVVSDTEIKHLGKTDMVDILNTLPQVFQNSATDFSNTSNSLSTPGGLTTVNLRGIGVQRTLVLVDGRRLGTADANTGNPNPAPNLDQIPVPLIERVDVVTGGASAVEGVQIDAQYGFNQHENDNGFMQGLADDAALTLADGSGTDGETLSVSIVGGTNIADDRGNFTAYLTYRQAGRPIRSPARTATSPGASSRPRPTMTACLTGESAPAPATRTSSAPLRARPRTRWWAISSWSGRRIRHRGRRYSTRTSSSTCRVTTRDTWRASSHT
jgi:outer membrane receptor protein involved in Fe transport